MSTTNIERSSLEVHVDLCALRYESLDNRLSDIEENVSSIQTMIEKSHMVMVKVMIGTAGTLITGMMSTLFVVLTKVH